MILSFLNQNLYTNVWLVLKHLSGFCFVRFHQGINLSHYFLQIFNGDKIFCVLSLLNRIAVFSKVFFVGCYGVDVRVVVRLQLKGFDITRDSLGSEVSGMKVFLGARLIVLNQLGYRVLILLALIYFHKSHLVKQL